MTTAISTPVAHPLPDSTCILPTAVPSRPHFPRAPVLNEGPASAREAKHGVGGQVPGWAELIAERDHVLLFLKQRCRDDHLAEDLAHDTLLRAARHRRTLEGVRNLRGWLVQIAVNVQRDHSRKEARHRFVPADHLLFTDMVGSEPIPGDADSNMVYRISKKSIGADELYEQVEVVLGQLPVRDRRILSLVYLNEISTQDAALMEDTTPGLVKVWLFRARRRLESRVRARLRAFDRSIECQGLSA